MSCTKTNHLVVPSKKLSIVSKGGGSDRKKALERDESKKKERQTAEVDFLFLVALW